MTDALAARGPDGMGVLQRGPLALGHRRLSIIDLSERAEQPMVDSELGLSLVYNGAIYNYEELRAELEGAGYRFFSSGDTEVVMKAYHAFGPDFILHLQGMFAFALFDRERQRLLLGRDPLGIKPLYWAEVEGGLRFSSSLPSLLAGGGIDTTIDEIALQHYLSFHSIVPAPRTILKGVSKLPPAHCMTVEVDGRRHEHRYWRLDFDGNPPGAAAEGLEPWRERTLDALRTAVGRRLVADVPVGVLLSGGLDSSLVVGLLAEAGQSDLETFSIGFESIGDEEGDEFRYSDLVAERFGTRHHKLFIDPARTLGALPRCVDAMSEPMVSHDAIGFYLLAEEVSRSVKVVQSGQGADEVFAGYHWYPPLLASEDPVTDYAEVFFDRRFDELQRVLHPGRAPTSDAARAFVEEHFAAPGADRPIDKALRIDTTVMLVDDPVKRVDNMTMAFGLEARVPFLDRDLVELAARIPAELKVAGGGKHVLKEAARSILPAAVIDRPKGYFPVPALKYLHGEFLDMGRDVLGQRAARERALFAPDYVGQLLERPAGHLTPLRGSKLWQLALLELWLQRHGI